MNKIKKKLITIGISTGILFSGLAVVNPANIPFVRPIFVNAATQIYTTISDLKIRKDPSINSTVIGTVKKGTTLNLTGTSKDGWYKVSYNNQTGFVSSKYVKATMLPLNYQYITTANLNVRTGSDVSYPTLGVLKKGTPIDPQWKLSNGWYQITYNRKKGYVNAHYVEGFSSSVIMNVPVVLQQPQLPNGCEVTSLTMALNYKGINIDKITLAKKMPYTKTLDANKGFIGSPFDKTGNTINPIALQKLAKKYRSKSSDMTGASIASIEKEVRAGNPVLVWYTIGYIDPVNHYLYQNGYKYWFPEPLHCIVVTGASSKYFFINDPLNGNKNFPIEKSRFNQIYSEMGKRALVVR